MAAIQKGKIHFEKSVKPDLKLRHKCQLVSRIPAVKLRTLSFGNKMHYSYFIQ